MNKNFASRCAAIRYEAVMVKSDAQHLEVIAGHRGTISMGEIDLEVAERALETALDAVRSLRVECEERRHAIAA